ncbi:uncharacterized protein LOC116617653 isoform X2 [Nematostella vectensis]|uniref:uncharacterized protein LOC125557317 isoform X2 n=1 Tax=Nematostella vectensis TaxID=45351 RepID=UPI0020779B46|nr:uncharacterized protein LOC125557317 isoform X2 [Nematostella vectensis]XP_048578503.1 uncharacterized protein LOC125560635 isoform X2 [Nematostella vectensis]XP_048579078.1 uncharacterized protein LOC116617653 isoform X2 [Nematostella vectensis]
MVSFALHFNERVEPEEIDHKKIQRALKAKDDGDVSDSAYHELKMVAGSSLPSLYGIQKERKAQNAIIPITEFEGNAKGCSRSIKDILSYSSDVIGNAGGNVITLRFSGDGRKTTKKLGSVMTTFCFPAENSVKRSPEREYCISIYDGKESYDILKATLRGVFDEMKALGRTGILVNGLEYTIDWVMEECRKFHLRSTGTKDFLRATLKDHLDRNNIVFEPSSTPTCEKTVLSISELTQVWKSLMVLTDALGANPGDEAYLRADAFQEKARQWGTKFRKATFDEDVIPYIHVLVYHVPQFLEIHGTIHQFNCQTVEKKNHMQNKTFHRGSQKGGKNSNYTVQIMERENRKLFSRENNLERVKRKYQKQ